MKPNPCPYCGSRTAGAHGPTCPFPSINPDRVRPEPPKEKKP
jgi:hypothetical protein